MFCVPYIWHEMGFRIGNNIWGGAKLTMGIMNLNLRRTEVRKKMEKIRLNHSLLYNNLPQEAQSI